ncbi:MAG: sulfotransferase domain-containing protein [Phycisphaerae bacterium]|nr:sulfotransferase domain-containing protein [Phycisphaerae bacterium]
MLLVVCGMPRSASTLQYQLVSEIVERTGAGRRLGWDWPAASPGMADAPRPMHVVKVHEPNPSFESRLDPRFLRYFYTYRDVRDAAASVAQWKGPAHGTPEAAAQWIRWADHFTGRPGSLRSRYEDWTRDIPGEIRRVESFLGLALPEPDRRSLAQTLSIEGQKDLIERELVSAGRDLDPRSLVWKQQIQDARVGKWRTFFDRATLDRFDALCGEWLAAHGYERFRVPRVA